MAESGARPRAGRRPQVRFPLWAKMGLVFGGLVGAAVALVGWTLYERDLQAGLRAYEARLLGLAQAVAGGIDGDEHQRFRRVADMARPEYRRLSLWLRQAAVANEVHWIGTLIPAGPTGLAYGIDPETDAASPPGFPLFDVREEERQALAGTPRYLGGLVDEWGTWDAAFAPIRAASGQIVGLVEVDADADARGLLQRRHLNTFLLFLGIAILAAVLAAVLFAGLLNRHLGKLSLAATALGEGDLDVEVAIPTRDEIGLLGRTFNQMARGLRERELLRETFGRFVSREVVAQLFAGPEGLKLGGELRVVTVLISDLRGFTGLLERLGPRCMVDLLNRYFSSMTQVIDRYEGTINELTGDGMVVLFGAPLTRADDAARAAACAVAMQQELARFNAAEGERLQMGIGLYTGEVVAGNIGSPRRMKYAVVGSPINLAARLESATVGSQVLVAQTTVAAAGPEVTLGPWLELHVKGHKEPLRCASLLGIGPPYALALPTPAPGRPARSLGLPARCRRVVGKQVDEEELPARLIRLGEADATLQTTWEPVARDDYLLSLDPPGEPALEELPVRAVEVRPGEPSAGAGGPDLAESGAGPGGFEVVVLFTSVPAREREILRRLLGEAG